ncbi:MAG: divalent-cation tolerance protein CutA [Planctomycetes bacterium]|nr:divalent-cation tolerance protein CutA [Planctomycetota bacterium]
MTTGVIVALCTAPGAVAETLAKALVGERLVACVNVVPGVRSFFRWQGEVDVADEVLLVIKTTRAQVPALQRRLPELHPYQVPELLVFDVADGLPAYLRWVVAAAAPAE